MEVALSRIVHTKNVVRMVARAAQSGRVVSDEEVRYSSARHVLNRGTGLTKNVQMRPGNGEPDAWLNASPRCERIFLRTKATTQVSSRTIQFSLSRAGFVDIVMVILRAPGWEDV